MLTVVTFSSHAFIYSLRNKTLYATLHFWCMLQFGSHHFNYEVVDGGRKCW